VSCAPSPTTARRSDCHILLSQAIFSRDPKLAQPIGDGMLVRQGLSLSARAVEGAAGPDDKARIVVAADGRLP